jgi:glutamate-1-semialdehyde aminotransferase
MTDKKISAPEKFMKILFTAAIAASLIFVGFRIANRSAYRAHETKQCQLLAFSAADMLAEKMLKDPAVCARLEKDSATLTTDHMKMKDNFNIELSVKDSGGITEITAHVKSGWNSRSPQSADCTARLLSNDTMKGVVFKGRDSRQFISKIHAVKKTNTIKNIVFSYPVAEIEKSPVIINAAVVPYGEENFFIIRLK